MTYEELKAEADKLGYNLMKKTSYVKLKRCPVCNKFPRLWYGNDGSFYKCHYISDPMPNERKAKEAWNRMVSDD